MRASLPIFAAFLLLGAPLLRAGDASKPNIILILADDLGMGDLGCYGGTLASTPNIDRLAKEGTRFTQYYTPSPICSPSRAGLLTGLAPARLRITSFLQTRAGNRGCEQADYLDPKTPTLPRALKAAGYATAHFGKWHLGGGRDVRDAPAFAAYGYDEYASTWESPAPHPDLTAGNWIWSEKDAVKRWDRTAFFVDKALTFLRSRQEQPCFVTLWADDPHTPWLPGPGAPKGETRENLQLVLTELDRQIGRLLEGLRDFGSDATTMVIFTSDNGPLPTFEGARSGGLRGSKLSLYEGGTRVPFIVRWPARTPPGRVDDETLFSALDLFPTLCSIAGVTQGSNSPHDGEDMAAALHGKSTTRTGALFWEYGRKAEFFKFPRSLQDRSPNVAIREGRWKLLVNADGSRRELYDVTADRAEARDVSGEHPEIAKQLAGRALAWRESMP